MYLTVKYVTEWWIGQKRHSDDKGQGNPEFTWSLLFLLLKKSNIFSLFTAETCSHPPTSVLPFSPNS